MIGENENPLRMCNAHNDNYFLVMAKTNFGILQAKRKFERITFPRRTDRKILDQLPSRNTNFILCIYRDIISVVPLFFSGPTI